MSDEKRFLNSVLNYSYALTLSLSLAVFLCKKSDKMGNALSPVQS